MPEGDTVWQTARRLDAALSGSVLEQADLWVPRLAALNLAGLTVVRTRAHGKHLFTDLSGGRHLHSHLGMDGAWRLSAPGRPLPGPRHAVRAVLATADARAVGLALPVLELLDGRGAQAVVSRLGPDLLGADWDAEEAVRRLSAAPARGIAEALLDQANLAGIGNVYANELCFLRGVTPWTPVSDAGDLGAVVALARRLLTANRDRLDRVTTGSLDRGRRLWVYGRVHQPCLRCGNPVGSGRIGSPGTGRIAFWCRACQRGPSPAARNAGSGRAARL